MSPKSRKRQRTVFTGLPTWSGIAVILAALVTGLLISLSVQQIGLPFLVCFVLAGITVALLTEPRGLFLTVASMPILFAVMTVLTSWSVGRSVASEGSPAFSTTTLVTAVYPLIEFFPVLFAVTAGGAAIAVLRLWLLKRSGRAREVAAQRTRRRDAENDRRNRATASRARRRTNQVTVEELLERNRRRAEEPPVVPGGDVPRPRAEGHPARPPHPAPDTSTRARPQSRAVEPEIRSPRQPKPQPRTRAPRPPQRPRRRLGSLDDDLYEER